MQKIYGKNINDAYSNYIHITDKLTKSTWRILNNEDNRTASFSKNDILQKYFAITLGPKQEIR